MAQTPLAPPQGRQAGSEGQATLGPRSLRSRGEAEGRGPRTGTERGLTLEPCSGVTPGNLPPAPTTFQVSKTSVKARSRHPKEFWAADTSPSVTTVFGTAECRWLLSSARIENKIPRLDRFNGMWLDLCTARVFPGQTLAGEGGRGGAAPEGARPALSHRGNLLRVPSFIRVSSATGKCRIWLDLN